LSSLSHYNSFVVLWSRDVMKSVAIKLELIVDTCVVFGLLVITNESAVCSRYFL